MKSINIPSVDKVLGAYKSTFKRFPSVITLGLIAMFYMFSINHDEARITSDQWRIVATLMLGLPLFFGANIFSLKKFSANLYKRLSCFVIALLSLLVFYYALKDASKAVFLIKYIIFSFSAHLFASVCYFYQKDQEKGFWQFNHILFIRFILSSLYSGVLYTGLIIILATINFLFKLDTPSEYYVDIFFICAFFFHIPLFLSGVPSKIQELNNLNDYPAGLKTFTQYLLIPLITTYTVILYIYGAKILFSWSLPKGQISFMIIIMSVLGILNLLLIHPKANGKNKENKWMNTYGRFFYVALIPLLILLYISIFKRIGDYGITESRYYVLFTALWITAISFYFIFNKKKDIRVIPASLLLCSLLSTFGPWGASQVSISSQLNRIESFLTKRKVLIDGSIKQEFPEITSEDFNQYIGSMRYLVKNFGANVFPAWKDNEGNTIQSNDDLKDIIHFLGLSKVNKGISNDQYQDGNGAYVYYRSKNVGSSYDIKDYHKLYRITSNQLEIPNSDGISTKMSFKGQNLEVKISKFSLEKIDVANMLRNINILSKAQGFRRNEVPQEQLTYNYENEVYKLKIIFESIDGNNYNNNKFKVRYYSGILLITFKKDHELN